jgi:hypothetical protein
MDELSIPNINSDMEWFLALDLEVNEVCRLEMFCSDRFPNPSQIMRLARKHKTHRMAVDIVDKPTTIESLRCGPAKAIGSPQQ